MSASSVPRGAAWLGTSELRELLWRSSEGFSSHEFLQCVCMLLVPRDICQPTSEALKHTSCLGSGRTAGHIALLLPPWRAHPLSIQGLKGRRLVGWESTKTHPNERIIQSSQNWLFFFSAFSGTVVRSPQNSWLELTCVCKLLHGTTNKSITSTKYTAFGCRRANPTQHRQTQLSFTEGRADSSYLSLGLSSGFPQLCVNRVSWSSCCLVCLSLILEKRENSLMVCMALN